MNSNTYITPFNENEYNKLLQQAVALLPWSHNLLLMGYNLSSEHIKFYTNEIITKGWSREMLSHALKAEYQYLIPKKQITRTYR